MKRFLSALAAPLALAVLSGFTAEFLLGDQYLSGSVDAGAQVGMLVLFTTFYGSAAVLIREVTRRTGRGWPTVLLLGLAFGVYEEGLLTQTLWDPHWFGFDLLSYGHLSWLGTAPPWVIFVLGLHTVWSTTTPVVVTEALFPARRGPWLRRGALVVPVVLLLIGSAGIAVFTWLANQRFVAHWWQLALSALVATLLVVVALTRTPTAVERPRPTTGRLLASGAFALVVGSGFQLAMQEGRWPAAMSVILQLLAVVVAVAGVRVLHSAPFGSAVGALATYGWVGLLAAARVGADAVVEQGVLLVLTAGVVVLAWRRSQRAVTSLDQPEALPVPASLRP